MAQILCNHWPITGLCYKTGNSWCKKEYSNLVLKSLFGSVSRDAPTFPILLYCCRKLSERWLTKHLLINLHLQKPLIFSGKWCCTSSDPVPSFSALHHCLLLPAVLAFLRNLSTVVHYQFLQWNLNQGCVMIWKCFSQCIPLCRIQIVKLTRASVEPFEV